MFASLTIRNHYKAPIGADQLVPVEVDGFHPFGLVAPGHAGHLVEIGLLLQAAEISEDGEDVHGARVSMLRRQVPGRDEIRRHCW